MENDESATCTRDRYQNAEKTKREAADSTSEPNEEDSSSAAAGGDAKSNDSPSPNVNQEVSIFLVPYPWNCSINCTVIFDSCQSNLGQWLY